MPRPVPIHTTVPLLSPLIAAAMLIAQPLPDQPPADRPDAVKRPAAAGRIVRVFDFEERDTNALPVPRGWYRAQRDPDIPRERPGFPIWNQAELDYDAPAHTGIGSVRLPTKGGSTSLVTRRAEIGVFPGADYMLSVRVRTHGLEHARARVVASLVDQKGRVLESTRRVSALIRSHDEWRPVTVFVEGTHDDAASMRIELQLLQPKQQPRDGAPPDFTVWPQDYDGAAWFDDLLIAQIPRIDFATAHDANIIPANRPPTLDLAVRDTTGERLSTHIRVMDADARVLDERRWSRSASSLRRSWAPDLPGPGWYRARLDVTANGRLVGRKFLNFAWLPLATQPDPSPFRLGVTRPDARTTPLIPAIVRAAGAAGVSITASHPASAPGAFDKDAAITTTIDELIRAEIPVSIALSAIPDELARTAALGTGQVRALLAEHPDLATPTLGPLMDRFGQIIQRWRLGDDGARDHPDALDQRLTRLADTFEPYVPGARIVLPWPFTRAPAPRLARADLSVADDPRAPADAMADLVARWAANRAAAPASSAPSDDPTLEIRMRPRDEAPHDRRIRENAAWIARRAIAAWWALGSLDDPPRSPALTLESPVRAEQGARGRVMPTPELVVWRTLHDALAGREPIRELDLAPGVRMLLCAARDDPDNPDTGALVLWRTEPTPSPAPMRIPFATSAVETVGVMGARRAVPLTRVSELELPIHEITPTRSPTIVTGVNPKLLEFFDRIELDPDRLDAAPGLRRHALSIANPWSIPIRGKLFIVEPGGYADPDTVIDRSWEISPRVVEFAVRPGETFERDISIGFSPAQIAGDIGIVYDIELDADRAYPLMRIHDEIPLDSDKIRLDLALRRDPGSDRVGVSAYVTNTADEPMFIELAARASGHARQETTISAVDPGATAERRFVFESFGPGDTVIVSARSDAARIQLNKRLTMP